VVYQRLVPRLDGGLVAAYEVLMANHAVRNLVREGKTRQLRNIVATHQQEGMQTLEMGLNNLMAEDLIDYDTALRVSLYPKELNRPSNYAGVRQFVSDGSSALATEAPRVTSI
jgi:twitching motility protein PilT